MKSPRFNPLQLPIEGTHRLADVLFKYLETGGFLCDGLTEREAEYLRHKFNSFMVSAVNLDRKATRQKPCAN